jgi:predicted PhzF superfamily epimerase YddE/YHI9
MATLHVLRVFCDEQGEHGNPLGVFLDGSEIPEERRQAVAHELGFSETVFVDVVATGTVRIFTPGLELGFGGHPAVGTAWLLEREGREVPALRPLAGVVEVRLEEGLTFVTARPEWGPRWELAELASPEAVVAVEKPEGDGQLPCIWAWVDEAAGRVRSRCFSFEDGIGEDEATGSAAIVLAAALGRELKIEQGKGSRLRARSLGDGRAEVGGRVVLDEVREFAL